MSDVLHRARFKRDHRWAPGHMSAYLDGELVARARSRLERHSDACPECRSVLHSLGRMLGLLHGLPPAGAMREAQHMAVAVRARLDERPRR